MEVCVRLVYCGVYLTPRCVELKVVKPDASNYRLQMFLRLKLFECSEKYYTRTSPFTFNYLIFSIAVPWPPVTL